jgi:hypothetical protein
VAGAALGRQQGNRVVVHARGRVILCGQHEQLADLRIVERALHLARHQLVVAHVDNLAVGLAHNARDIGHVRKCGEDRLGLHLNAIRRGRFLICDAGCAVLREFVTAQNAGSGAGHQQQQSRHRRRLKAGKIVQHPFAEALVPAFGRQCVQSFVKAQARAGHQIRPRLRNRMRVGENFERPHLLALLAAL